MVLPPSFYERATLEVAADLIGAVVIRGEVRLRIVEAEAYLPGDSACHAWMGRTPRNATMWGPAGRAYVYLCYGVHHMLNFVTEPDGVPAAVLVRACEVLGGHEVVRARRGGRPGARGLDLRGPGKVGQALALDTSWSGAPLDGELAVMVGAPPARILTGPRVGIDYALPEHRDAPWRFWAG